MSQVLARKYRPRNFDQLVGQDHVSQALVNALTNDRLHHAYLFVGTRGVGKTSIARILARCLNCEQGIGPNPCLTCGTCQSIESGRFIDLIEVDAASRTKVEDTRELLENVQYAPSEGRFKVYLIDEVHMLSISSFNALLKTLEEPPAHVKFLLATTDPQKVPMTVLSRCLQFRLRDLPADEIASHLASVLDQEQIAYDASALTSIGQAARGSIRDAMTLTDQAIAYDNGTVTEGPVRAMLGIQGQESIVDLLSAIAAGQSQQALDWVAQTAQVAPDWNGLVEATQRHLHEIAVNHAMGTSGLFGPEETQLNYQIATQAYQDLPLAPEGRIGFEMMVLRMLAFRPARGDQYPEPGSVSMPQPQPQSIERPAVEPKADPIVAPESEASAEAGAFNETTGVESVAAPATLPQPTQPSGTAPKVDLPWSSSQADSQAESQAQPQAVTPAQEQPVEATGGLELTPEPAPKPSPDPVAVENQGEMTLSAEQWTDLLGELGVAGFGESMLRASEWLGLNGNYAQLRIPEDARDLFSEPFQKRAANLLAKRLGRPVSGLQIEWTQPQSATPAEVLKIRAAERLQRATESFSQEPSVQWLAEHFDGQVDPSSIVPKGDV